MGERNRCIFEFGPFRLDAQKRLLLRAGVPVKLYPKEFDMLLALVEQGGEVVDKDALLRKVWPGSTVEEGNLTTYVSHLRKALGETRDQHDYIVTVPGQGYRFVARVKQAFDDVIVPERTRPGIRVEEAEVEPDAAATAGEAWTPDPAFVTQTETAASRSRPRLALFVVLSGLLLAGAGGALWSYQSRNRDREPLVSDASRPPQPMTLRRFATHGGVPIRVSISPDGKSLVYQQRIKGKDSLWLGQIETNTSVPISQRTDLEYGEPAFAPDGNSIYFTVSGEARQSMLVRMPVLGGVMTELIPHVDSRVTFSPGGRQLAFLRADDESKQISIIVADTADGRNERTLITRTWQDSLSSQGLSWSPDGKTIAVGAKKPDGQDELLAVNSVDGRIKKIGGRDWGRIGNVEWLPDGSGLALFARDNAVARRTSMWVVPYPDGEARKITDDLNIYLANSLSVSAGGKLAILQGFIHSAIWVAPEGDVKRAKRVLEGVAPRYEGVDGLAWTLDGRLLYTAYVGDPLAIWSMNSDGSDLRQLTVNQAGTVDNQMCVTADGRFIVFQSNRSGALEIWRANTDGSNLKQLTTGGSNSLPSLSPDSRWVVYTSLRDGKATLWRTSIDGGAASQLTDESSSWAQVSPDGRHIAYMATSETPGVRLMIAPFEGVGPVKSFTVPKTGLIGRRVMRWTPDRKAILYTDNLQGLWRQALDEEKPHLFKGFEELKLHHFAWSFDGKNLAYTTGPTTQEIILIENFK